MTSFFFFLGVHPTEVTTTCPKAEVEANGGMLSIKSYTTYPPMAVEFYWTLKTTIKLG